MRNILLIGTLVVGLMGCTKEQAKEVLCDTGKTAAVLVAAQVTTQLDCKNTDAIKADIEKKLVDLKVCTAPKPANTVGVKSVIGDTICKSVVEGLMAGLLTQIPEQWGCTGGKVSDSAKAKILEACAKAL